MKALWGKLREAAGFRLFAARTERDFVALAMTGAIFILPFSINHLVQGRLLIGGLTTALVLWFVAHGVSVLRGRRLASATVIFLPTLGVLFFALKTQGPAGVFWAYPALLLFHFVLDRRTANLFNATVVTMAVPIAYASFGTEVTLRVGATLVLTIVFANVFSYVSEQQQRRAAEQERALSEQAQRMLTEQKRLELVVRAGSIGILDWDGVSRTAYYSRRFKEILGYPGDADTSGWPDYFEMIHPDDRFGVQKRFRDHVLESSEQEMHETIEYRLRRADGSYVWVEAVGVSERDASGYVLRFIASIRDISERRGQEERLHEQVELTRFEQRRLDLVVRAAQVGIVDWDGRTHETFFSPRFREILGHPPDTDTSGWPDYFRVLIHPEDRERIMGRWRDFILGKGPEGPLAEDYLPEEYRLIRADGSAVWVQVSGVAVRDAKGFVTRWIAAITDITERRAHEEALRESVRLREEVERMSRHDLKAPLNSVIAVSRLLREGGKLAREDDELLGIVERAGYRILNMVNLSLDLFRMEQGTYQFRPQAVDIADVAEKVAADLYGQAESKHVTLHVRRPASAQGTRAPVAVRGEEILCYSMLANLVKNAIEASPEHGMVTVAFSRLGREVTIEVRNAGAVHESVRESFFEKYASAGKPAGLGIGTYSARLMALVQEGDITMRSSEAEGTTVSVWLAAADAASLLSVPKSGERARAMPALPPLAVLVADDDEFNRLVLRRMLPTPPIRLAMAVNGRAALDAAELEWPDVVFLDLEMPVMDGYEAARRLREMERSGRRRRCTVVAFSSNDEQAIIERALAAGCDYYLVKPASREALWAVLAGGSPAIPSELADETEATATSPVLLDPDLEHALEAFRSSRMELLDRMGKALAEGHRPAFRRLAHQVAGSCALYGFVWAASQCRALEADAAQAPAEALAERARAVREHFASVEVRIATPAG